MNILADVEAIFAQVLSMSIAASLLIVAVLVARALLKIAPRWITFVLWTLVGIRLLCPLSLESPFSAWALASSLFHDALPVLPFGMKHDSTGSILANSMSSGTGILAGDGMDGAAMDALMSGSAFAPGSTMPAGTDFAFMVAAMIWLAGMIGMAVYAIVSYLRIRKSVRDCVPCCVIHETWGVENAKMLVPVYCADAVRSPFILGIFRPQIYLPSNIDSETASAVIRHENAHLKRRDNIWKPLAYAVLAIHWFNPLCWLAFVLLSRDMEVACDEKVISRLDLDERKMYAHALVNCCTQGRMISACPVAFGEVGVKERVKDVLNYKRPAFWVITAAVIACVVVAFFFMTNPAEGSDAPSGEADASAPSEVTDTGNGDEAEGLDSVDEGEWSSLNVDGISENLSNAIVVAIKAHNKGGYAPESDFELAKYVLFGFEERFTDKKVSMVRAYIVAGYQEYEERDGETSELGGSIVPAALTFKVSPEGAYTLLDYQEPGDGAQYAEDMNKLFPPEVCKKIKDHWAEITEDFDGYIKEELKVRGKLKSQE